MAAQFPGKPDGAGDAVVVSDFRVLPRRQDQKDGAIKGSHKVRKRRAVHYLLVFSFGGR
jgi:hypothetical protein